MIQPFFTIIVPTYNRSSLLKKTIQSLSDQSYAGFEVIIVDDGSTDDTESVVLSCGEERVRYYRKENGERGAARNYGIERAKGQYITFIDSDDLLYPHALSHAAACLQQLGLSDCFAQAFEVKDIHTGKQLQAPARLTSELLNDAIIKGNFLGCIGVFIKREVFETVRFEEDRLFAGTEDWLLWLQIAARYPFYYSNTVCACMVEHQDRSVLSFSEEKLLYRATFIKQKLIADKPFMKRYSAGIANHIYAHMLTYCSLHLAMSGKKSAALKYLVRAGMSDGSILFSRRTLGIFKNILLR